MIRGKKLWPAIAAIRSALGSLRVAGVLRRTARGYQVTALGKAAMAQIDAEEPWARKPPSRTGKRRAR